MSTMSTSATLANPAAGGAIAGTPVAAAAGAAVAVAETVAGAVSGLVQSAIGEEQKTEYKFSHQKHRPADETKPQKKNK